MELKFLGRGAAFNPKEGNNSAYFIENNQLFLIDCGESIFERLFENGLLKSVESINLMITHTHYDHEHADQDMDVVFPLALMQALAERGVIGSVAPRNYGLMGYIPQVNRLISGTGPEMADALAADGVDICLLSPG